MSLLDLMHQALFGEQQMSQRKMFFKVHVLYIDEGPAVYGWTPEFHQKQINMIRELCEQRYGFSWTIVPIELIFGLE